jgi:hypothetical protein
MKKWLMAITILARHFMGYICAFWFILANFALSVRRLLQAHC